MLLYEFGDIVKGDYPIFCHQVNCQGVMGSGIAKQIRSKYPEVYREFKQIKEPILGFILPVTTKDGRICINMFAQDNYGKDGKKYTDYEAFKKCLDAIEGLIKDHHIKMNVPIAFPYGIGCGFGGGDWNIIQGLLKDFSEKISQNVVIVSLK